MACIPAPCAESVTLERLAETKINCNISSGLQSNSLRGVALPVPFIWTDDSVRILGVWFEPDFRLVKNCSEVDKGRSLGPDLALKAVVFSLLLVGGRSVVRREVCIQRP